MYRGVVACRVVVALLLLIAATAASSAQGLFPSVWRSERGAILKVLWADPAGNFGGVFITSPGGPCPGVPYDLRGRFRGQRVAFVTSRTWTADCRATVRWIGRFVNPTTVATRFVATLVGPDGRTRRVRGSELFRRI